MKTALALTVVLAAAAAAPAAAQQVSLDLGLGAEVEPAYPGADSQDTGPWLIWRRAPSAGGGDQGFDISPSLGLVGPRNEDADPALAGLGDIDRAFEIGARVSYGAGPVTAYGTLRKGFGGHEGLTGSIGAKYRTDVNDRLTLWSGLSVGYGNGEYMQTYFGVDADQAAASGYPVYQPGGGFKSATAKLEARYAVTENTAILGEVEYGRLIGDAADSPIVQDRDQPAVRLGIVRRFSFGF